MPAAIDGVYDGTYTCAIGPRTLKLSLAASGQILTATFTFYLPPTSHGHAYSYSMSGTLDAATGKFRLTPVKWETQAPPGYVMVGMDGVFDSSKGEVTGKILFDRCSTFEARNALSQTTTLGAPGPNTGAALRSKATATVSQSPAQSASKSQEVRTEAESKLNAAPQQTSGTASPPQTENAAPSAIPAQSTKAVAQHDGGRSLCPFLTEPQAESLLGGKVQLYSHGSDYCWYRGSDPEKNQVQYIVRHKTLADPIAVNRQRDYIAHREPRPTIVKDISGIGDAAIWVWGPESGGTFHAFKGGTIEVEIIIKGPVQEAALQGVKAIAVRALGGANGTSYAYLKQGEATIVAKGLVRKSNAYWDKFPADIARQIFDGDFGFDMDSFQRFQVFFATYVDLFAQHCPQSFLAPHETVTITEVTVTHDSNGNEVSRQEGHSTAVEVESRLAPYYRKYVNSMNNNPGQGLVNTVKVLSGRANEIFDPAQDASMFFKTEGCKSAAMRQMDENLFRAAAGKYSLQWARETIPGAAAETDRSLPPDRFTNFANACVADARSESDPLSSRFNWCECLYLKYRQRMSPAEQERYANDFTSFDRAITNPQDPAYHRLIPTVNSCQQ